MFMNCLNVIVVPTFSWLVRSILLGHSGIRRIEWWRGFSVSTGSLVSVFRLMILRVMFNSSYIDFTVGSIVGFFIFSSGIQDLLIKVLWIPMPSMIFCLSSCCIASNYIGTSKFHWKYLEYIFVSYDCNSSVIYSTTFTIWRKSPQNLVARRLGRSQRWLGSAGVESSSDRAKAEKLLISRTWLWDFTTWPIFTTKSQYSWTSSCLIILDRPRWARFLSARSISCNSSSRYFLCKYRHARLCPPSFIVSLWIPKPYVEFYTFIMSRLLWHKLGRCKAKLKCTNVARQRKHTQ
jgi:hypothetical protein